MTNIVPFVIYKGKVIIPEDKDVRNGKYVVEFLRVDSSDIIPFYDESKEYKLPSCRKVRHTRTIRWVGISKEKLVGEWDPKRYVQYIYGELVYFMTRVHELEKGIRFQKGKVKEKRSILRLFKAGKRQCKLVGARLGENPQEAEVRIRKEIKEAENELRKIKRSNASALRRFNKVRSKVWIFD